jgi:NAD(P)-dependent dehydrogenase (short-subunit alcohol dehydrogenase family)
MLMTCRPSVQVAVVTGGARGLGNEFCRAFVRSGCTELAIVDLKEEEAVESAEALIKEACRADSPWPPPRDQNADKA